MVGTAIAIGFTGFQTPAFLGSYAAKYSLQSIVQKVKYQYKNYTASVTYTQGASLLVGATTTSATSLLQSDSLVIYTFSITFNAALDASGVIEITFPTGFTIAAS